MIEDKGLGEEKVKKGRGNNLGGVGVWRQLLKSLIAII
jgi:hypothetical protein